MPDSVRARILNLARKERIPFQRLLALYNQEGLLHRIVSTEYESSIILKGGLLFYQLQGMAARPTKDIDLLGKDNGEPETTLRAIIESASTINLDDGLEFDRDSIGVAPITGQVDQVREYVYTLSPGRYVGARRANG